MKINIKKFAEMVDTEVEKHVYAADSLERYDGTINKSDSVKYAYERAVAKSLNAMASIIIDCIEE